MNWWVKLPEVGASNTRATVVQSATDPGGALGPYTHAQAQAEATRYNNAFGLSTNPLKAAAQLATGKTAQTNANNSVLQDVIGNVNVGALAMRIGEIILGIVLIGVGVSALAKESPTVQKAVESAAKAAKIAAL